MTDCKKPKAGIDVLEIVAGHPVPSDWDSFINHRDDRHRLFRIELSGHDPAALKALMGVVNSNSLVIERCLDTDSISGVHAYDDILAIQLPVAADWEASIYPKLTILCFSNALIMIRAVKPLENPDNTPDELASFAKRSPSLEGMLFSILDTSVDRASNLTLKARMTVDQLEMAMSDITDEEEFGHRILNLKRAVAHFEMALEAKHRTLTALLSLDTGLIDLELVRESLRDVVGHVEHSLRYVERIEDHLSELDRHFLYLLQNRTNNRLRILTIISAIFMPLTLIAGIYGMNFQYMPELLWRYGYGGVLLFMAGVALGLIVYFYRKDWFK